MGEGDEDSDGSSDDDDDDDDGSGNESEGGDPVAGTKRMDEEDNTVESMDSQEFLNQHNDECDVCSLGGELLCCSTCTLVFHLDCVRPKLKELPDGDWSCAYCVLGGNAGDYKKTSKGWKAAAAAVRHMGRLRNSNQRGSETGKEEEDEDSDEDGEGHIQKDTTSDTAEDEEPASATETEKHSNAATGKNLELYKISDALSPTFKVDPKEPTGRGRRPRRQPILYDPQDGPDSRWRSDDPYAQIGIKESGNDKSSNDEYNDDEEKDKKMSPGKRRRPVETTTGEIGADTGETLPEGKEVALTEDNTDIDSKAKNAPSPENIRKQNVEDGDSSKEHKKFHWCNFCHDDPNVPICVFCACRICFGKHEKEKLLLCDQCDEEYHTFCLKPPLTSVPSSKTWFCPSCKASTSADQKTSTRRLSSTPSKVSTPTSTRSPSMKTSNKGTPKSSPKSTPSTSAKTSTGRPRGRPPKSKSPQTPSTGPISPPRKRGRPPKNPQVMTSPPLDGTPAPRKRGRPPKSPPSDVSQTPAKKKPGPKPGSSNKRSISPTSRKAEVSTPTTKKLRTESGDSSAVDPASDATNEPIKVSRSGRVVKRSSFHDELEEGEQHLRTTRRSDAESSLKAEKETGTEDEASRGDSNSAGDVTMGTEEDTAGHEDGSAVEHPGHGSEDELSEDTGDGRPVRTKVIEPPGSNTSQQEHLEPPPPVIPIGSHKEVEESPKPSKHTSETERVPESQGQAHVSVAPRADNASTVTPLPTETSKPDPLPPPDSKTTESDVPVAAPPPPPLLETSKIADSKPKADDSVKPVPKPGSSTGDDSEATTPLAKSSAVAKAVTELTLQADVQALVKAAIANIPTETEDDKPNSGPIKAPRRKPGARECMQISRRFGARVISKKYMDTLLDYCTRGKVEHLIRMRERLDEHSRYLEAQLAGLEALVREKGETDVVVPPLPERPQNDVTTTSTGKPSLLTSTTLSRSTSSSTPTSLARPAGTHSAGAGAAAQLKSQTNDTKEKLSDATLSQTTAAVKTSGEATSLRVPSAGEPEQESKSAKLLASDQAKLPPTIAHAAPNSGPRSQ